MTRKERYRQQLNELEGRRGRLLRSGRYMEAQNLHADIQKIERMIREADEYEKSLKPKPVKEVLSQQQIDEMGLIPLMIEAHLVADFLVEIADMLVDICDKHNIGGVVLPQGFQELIRNAEKFASSLTSISPELSDLVVNNETFNASLHKKYLKYIEQRLKPKRKTK